MYNIDYMEYRPSTYDKLEWHMKLYVMGVSYEIHSLEVTAHNSALSELYNASTSCFLSTMPLFEEMELYGGQELATCARDQVANNLKELLKYGQRQEVFDSESEAVQDLRTTMMQICGQISTANR